MCGDGRVEARADARSQLTGLETTVGTWLGDIATQRLLQAQRLWAKAGVGPAWCQPVTAEATWHPRLSFAWVKGLEGSGQEAPRAVVALGEGAQAPPWASERWIL
jgi:hypothetical protein